MVEEELARGKVSEAERVVALAARTVGCFNTGFLLQRLRNARRDARRVRSVPVRRVWLRKGNMQRVVRALHTSVAARTFAIQSCLCLRVRTLQELLWEDVSVRVSEEWGTVLDIVIRHEKSPTDQGARVIRGLPVRMELVREESGWWGEVVAWMAAERGRRASGDAVIPQVWRDGKDRQHGYAAYLRCLRSEVAPLAGISPQDIDTHAARRTGACLHYEEGWSLPTIAMVGGWEVGDVRHLMKYIRQAIEVASFQRQAK